MFFPEAPVTTTLQMAADDSLPEDPPLTHYEIRDAVRSLDNNKAPGFDYLTAPIIKEAYEVLDPIFDKWMNACLSFGVFPKYFKKSRVKLIPKPNVIGVTTHKAWRPICLLPIMGKVLDKLMTSRINWHIWSKGHMSDHQYGFRPQTGTTDAIENLIHYCDDQKKNYKVLLISLDVSGAFDCAQWIDILNALTLMDCPPNILKLVSDYLKNRFVNIEFETGNAQKRQTQGACQGSVAGPVLWNILFNEVLRMDFGPNVKVQAYADDLIIKIRGRKQYPLRFTINDLVKTGNLVLKKLFDWGLKKHIVFNPTKTKAMLIRTYKNKKLKNLQMNGTPIDSVKDMQILGVLVDSKLKFDKHIRENCEKAMAMTTKFGQMMKNVSGIKPDARTMLYNQVIEPRLTYGLEIIPERCKTTRNLAKLERAQKAAMSRTASSYCDASHSSLTAITATVPIGLKVQQLAINRKIRKGGLNVGRAITTDLNECIAGKRVRTDMKYFSRAPPYKWSPIHTNYDRVGTQVTIATDIKVAEELITVSFGCQFGNECHTDVVSFNEMCSETSTLLMGLLKGLLLFKEKCSDRASIALFVGRPYMIKTINKFNSMDRIVNGIHRLIDLKFNGYHIELTRESNDNPINERLKYELREALDSQHITKEDLPVDPKKLKTKVKKEVMTKWEHWWTHHKHGKHTLQYIPSIEERLKWKHFQPSFVLTQYITDHGKFGGYLGVRNLRAGKDCPYCKKHGIRGTEDNPLHRLLNCEGTQALRQANDWLFTNGSVNWSTALKTKDNYKKFLNLVNEINSQVFDDLWREEALNSAQRRQNTNTNQSTN